MCKNYQTQCNVIEQAKRDTPEVYAVYEQGPVPDLVGIVKVIDRTTAELFDVHRYGDIELFKRVPVWSAPSNRTIANWFGLSHMYRVARV